MKRLLLFLSLVLFIAGAQAQMVDIEVEAFLVHPDTPYSDGTDLSGFTTYRVYAVTQNTGDFVSAVYGVNDIITQLSSTTSFWQSPFGGVTADNINPAFFSSFPSMEWDSFVTIGKLKATDPGPQIFLAEDPGLPWIAPFEAGNPISMCCAIGGSWFTVNFGPDPDESPNGYAGDDYKVLIAQLTTDGDIFGCINAQVFVNGVGANQVATEVCIGGAFGCTDSEACNFDSLAELDNGSCLYPCALVLENIQVTPPVCQGNNNGQIIVTVSGGQNPVTYQLNSNTPQVVGIFNGIVNNTYNIHIQDGAGICEDSGICAIDTTIVVNTPALTVSTAISSPVLCNGDCNGAIDGTAAGVQGTGMFSLTSNFTNPQSTPDFSGLCPGSYTIYGTDDAGCLGQSTPVVFTNPLVLNTAVQSTAAATCSDTDDGTIVMFTTGGTGDVDYSLDGITYQETGVIITGGGTYTVYAIDANGCIDTAPVTVGAPAPINLVSNATDVLCFGDENGTIISSATGGNGGFQFTLDENTPDNTGDYTNLAPGDYDVAVEDDEGCTASTTVTVGSPDELMVTASADDISCFGEGDGSVTITVTGGTEDYTYSDDGVVFGSDNMFDGLDAGSYDFWVVDDNGCAMTASASIDEPTELTITVDTVIDENDSDGTGSIDITIAGGTGSYDVSWTGGATSSDEDLDNLSAGSYNVTVTDENGCETTVTAIIVDNIVGINEHVNTISFTVSPNPSNGAYLMNISGLNGEKVSYTITDLRGRTVASKQLNVLTGNFVQTIDITSVENGMYLLTLNANATQKTVRLIKQN
jgi:hypothetical protein